MATQTVVNWINTKFSATRSKEDFEQMESFCLLWNLFEKKVGNGSKTSVGLPAIKKYVTDNYQNINIDNAIMDSCFNYFQNRYIENGVSNNKLDTLFRSIPTDEKHKNKLKKLLTKNSQQTKTFDKILGILTITYRIRNNSFHGTKGLPEIVNQKQTFEHLNDFLN